MSKDIFVHLLPLAVHGACTKNEDGSYSIFINENDSLETQRETYIHEVSHIEGEDFLKYDVQDIERANNERCQIKIRELESASI